MTQETKTVASTCWECSTHCGAHMTTENGKVTKIVPNVDHPASLGAFCVKGFRGLPELTYHPDRVLHPMRRTAERGDGQWRRISWDDALDEMCDRLIETQEKHGPLSLCGAVSNAHFSRGVSLALLMRAFGSPNWMMNQDLCGGCRALSDKLTGLTMGNGEDIDNTNCALIVGRNPSAADPTQWLALKRAQKKGAKIITIDPARTQAAAIADLWLQPKLGTDAAIALAMVNWMITNDRYDHGIVKNYCHGFDALSKRAANYTPEYGAKISGVPADDIVKAAEWYADGPSCFVSGHGIDAFSAGVQTYRAFHALVAISGNLDRIGGNRRVKKPAGFTNYIEVVHKPEFRLPLDVEEQTIGADRFPLWAGPRGWQTACHNPSVINAVLTGKPYPVRAMYVTGVNIVVTYPNTQKTIEALKSLDYLCVATHTMTPTAEFADLVLPKTTGLEDEEISLEANGPCLSVIQPSHPPVGEARSDFWIAGELVKRLEARGRAEARNFFPWHTKREFNEFLLGDCGIDMETLLETGYAEYDYELGNFAKDGFKTPTGKIELYSKTLEGMGLDPLPDYVPTADAIDRSKTAEEFPLLLLTGAREKSYHHSRFRDQDWARKVAPDPWLQLHPDTAAAYGVETDDWVTVETAGHDGSCRLKVRVTDETMKDIARTGMGWWYPEAAGPERGALDVNVNAALTYDGPKDPVTGSSDIRGIPCRIIRTNQAAAAE
ncbi:MAG: molybdopterin-containing oxidoreductase family protein [Alphaproteobacteria bacterium]